MTLSDHSLDAGEIVGADGMAEIGPATFAPVSDETSLAQIGLEAFCLAHGGVRGMPEQSNGGRAEETGFCRFFIVLEGAGGRSNVKIDETRRP